MKELVVISGKGGTGKSSLLAAFASLAQNQAICDADVDAADLHLIMNPRIMQRHDFISGHTAQVEPETCTQCGLCRELCEWDAIGADFKVDPIACEGCGVCYYFCPEKAIAFPDSTCGQWFLSETRFGPMAHARLGIAEENSGKLVTLIRQEGRKLAEERGLSLLLTDGPPGIGCPVIASLGGASAVLIVAEPTVSGRHDMERVVQLSDFFKIPAMVCINKFDLNADQTQAIESYAEDKSVALMGRIPFDPVFTHAMVQAQTIFEHNPLSEGAQAVKKVWDNVSRHLQI
jgi:MinD superfamily P-loop ATPase